MHTAMFFGVFYFGQIQVIFYGTLGVIASLSALPVRRAGPRRGTGAARPGAPDAPRGGAAARGAPRSPGPPSLADGLLRRRSP